MTYPLPVAAQWNVGYATGEEYYNPAAQIQRVQQGHQVLVTFLMPSPTTPLNQAFTDYYQAAIQQCAALKLPICFSSTQWESLLPTYDPTTTEVNKAGQTVLSPFGPTTSWNQIGIVWTNSPGMKQLQAWYPDPPMVILLSNNEQPKLLWTEAEDSVRYLTRFKIGKSDDFKRMVFGNAWIEKYQSLQDGLKEGLTTQWSGVAKCVGYNAFGPSFFGRFNNWDQGTLNIPNQIDSSPRMWDGGSPSYYVMPGDSAATNPTTDFTACSPQVGWQNLVFMQQEAYQINPDFWFEQSVYDGNSATGSDKIAYYRSLEQTYDPARYAGFIQFGMWLLRPKVVREYRDTMFPTSEGQPYFEALMAAVDRVSSNATLKDFWQNGTLVPNPSITHPYQIQIPQQYQSLNRNYMLTCGANQSPPWSLSTKINVFSIALTKGVTPNRQWLVYAHAPLDQVITTISIPQYHGIGVLVSRGGSFVLVDEKKHIVTPIN